MYIPDCTIFTPMKNFSKKFQLFLKKDDYPPEKQRISNADTL
jgi:hypothetical protein